MTLMEVGPSNDVRTVVIPKLTATERARLANLEVVIGRGFEHAVEVGQALRAIRDEGLYRDVMPPTWEEYLKQRWELGRTRAYQFLDAAAIGDATSTIVDIPVPSEWVARELAPLLRHKNGSKRVAQAWAKVVQHHQGNRPPTRKDVRRLLLAEGYLENRSGGSGKLNRRILLGQFGDRLAAAEKRLERFLGRELGGRAPGRDVRELAEELADRCDAMAESLRRLAKDER